MSSQEIMLIILLCCIGLNGLIAVLFWLHEKLEHYKMTKLQYAVEKAVRAVEQLCANMNDSAKKAEAIARVRSFLGIYRWIIPALVIDTAIEAELFIINQMHEKLSVDHDTPEEVLPDEISD